MPPGIGPQPSVALRYWTKKLFKINSKQKTTTELMNVMEKKNNLKTVLQTRI